MCEAVESAELVEPEGFDEFWRDYLVGLAFTAMDDAGEGEPFPLWHNSGGSIDDVVDADDVERILRDCGELDDLRGDCVDFLACAFQHKYLTPAGVWDGAGSNFHFTRNRHGAGFWDGDWKCGNELTELSHPYSTAELTWRRKPDATEEELDGFEGYEWMVVH